MEIIVIIFLVFVFCVCISSKEIDMDEKPYMELHFNQLQFSPQQFYKAIEQSLFERQIPGLRTKKISRPEGGLFSAQRLYLRIKRKNLVIDVCSFPFGTGQFVSCRSGKAADIRKKFFGEKSIIYTLLDILVYKKTFFRNDQDAIFKKLVNESIGETIGAIQRTQGHKHYKG